MNLIRSLVRTPNRRIAVIAMIVFALDQLTKFAVVWFLAQNRDPDAPPEKILLPGFFKLVHWGNTGAAWSLFSGNNALLAVVALGALIILFFSRHHFDSRTLLGQTAFGLIIGGVLGNLLDRVRVGHVIDFLYFYIHPRGAENPIGFPAFNIADSGICIGVALVFLITWKNEHRAKPEEAPAVK